MSESDWNSGRLDAGHFFGGVEKCAASTPPPGYYDARPGRLNSTVDFCPSLFSFSRSSLDKLHLTLPLIRTLKKCARKSRRDLRPRSSLLLTLFFLLAYWDFRRFLRTVRRLLISKFILMKIYKGVTNNLSLSFFSFPLKSLIFANKLGKIACVKCKVRRQILCNSLIMLLKTYTAVPFFASDFFLVNVENSNAILFSYVAPSQFSLLLTWANWKYTFIHICIWMSLFGISLSFVGHIVYGRENQFLFCGNNIEFSTVRRERGRMRLRISCAL